MIVVSMLLLSLAFILSILSMKVVEYSDKRLLHVKPNTEIIVHRHIPSTVNKCEITVSNGCSTVLNVSVLYVDIDTLQEVPVYVKTITTNASASFLLSKELLRLLPVIRVEAAEPTTSINNTCVTIYLEYVITKYPYSWLAIPSFVSMVIGATMIIFIMMYLPIRKVLSTQRRAS